MSEKFPELNSLDSMEGVPSDFSSEQPVQIPKQERIDALGKVEGEGVTSEQLETPKKAELMQVSNVKKTPGLARLPPSFYRVAILSAYERGDEEELDVFLKAINSEEKSVIEKEAFKKSRERFQHFSDVLSSLDFVNGRLDLIHEAFEKPYEDISTAMYELRVIELVTRSKRYRSLYTTLIKTHQKISDIRGECKIEDYRQKESLWVRMFDKDRSKIIALSQTLKDFQNELKQTYDSLFREGVVASE